MDNEPASRVEEKISAPDQANGWLSKLRAFLEAGAQDWNVSLAAMKFICSLPFLIAGSGALTAVMGKSAYKWFTAEDGFSENLQVVLWTITFILGFAVMRRRWQNDEKLIAVLYGILNVGIFFLIGEELSWGQRIFGWATSPEFAAINKQHETNIHNIHGVGDTFKWVHVLIGAYGTILPLLVIGSKNLAVYQKKLAALVPPLTLLPFFALPLVWRLYVNLFEPPPRFTFVVAEYSEVIELILACGFLLFIVYQLKQTKRTAGA
jgi:hypothetical protein